MATYRNQAWINQMNNLHVDHGCLAKELGIDIFIG